MWASSANGTVRKASEQAQAQETAVPRVEKGRGLALSHVCLIISVTACMVLVLGGGSP